MSDVQHRLSIFEAKSWEPNRHHGIPRRIAALLDWRARHQPGVFLSYGEIAQSVLRLKSKLGRHSKLTQAVVEDLYHARKLLGDQHGRDLITNGRGARATIDAEEIFRFRLGPDLTRVASQLGRYGRTAQLILDSSGVSPKLATHARQAQAFATVLGTRIHDVLSEWGLAANASRDDATDDEDDADGYLDA